MSIYFTSPQAAEDLLQAIAEDNFMEANDLEGATDCPEGCEVEPDGKCPHGYLSALRTSELI